MIVFLAYGSRHRQPILLGPRRPVAYDLNEHGLGRDKVEQASAFGTGSPSKSVDQIMLHSPAGARRRHGEPTRVRPGVDTGVALTFNQECWLLPQRWLRL
jgi:hypothetical protein